MKRKIRMQGMVLGAALLGSQAVLAQGAEMSGADEQVMQIVQGSNELGSALVAQLAKEGENVFISPYSIASALSLLEHCSEEGEQVEELRAFLGHGNMTEEQLLESQRTLLEELQPDAGFSLTEEEKEEWGMGSVEIGNALYMDDQTETAEGFDGLKELLDAFGAETGVKDLSTEEAMKEINSWVKEKTHEMIDSILDEPLSEDAVMLLMNTVYFMGNWSSTFDEEGTDIQTFHGTQGDASVSMMHQRGHFMYAETEDYQIISLPYQYAYSMYVYLPKEENTWQGWSDAEQIRQLKSEEYELESKEVILSMPRFELTYSARLNDPLMELGLSKIFEGEIYDRISTEELAVSDILHKTALKNDENGTEASAVTAMAVCGMAMVKPETPVEFTIDRPFYFTITHNKTGLNLFEGCVFNLDAAE